jgi:hypothetical protein
MAKKTNLRLMAMAIMVVLIGAGSAWAGLTDGLVAHWKLDETSGTVADDSAGGNDGTLINGPVWTDGQINGALEFDGVNDYINCGDILDNKIRNAFTIGVWIKLGEGALQKTYNYVLWKSDDRPGIYVRSSGVVFFAHWYTGSDGAFQSTHVLEEGKWYYISYVFDGSEFIGYINAEYAGSTPDTGYSPGGNLLIASDERSSRRFKGVIDDVRIYNRALSAEEVEELYELEAAKLVGLEIQGPDEVAEDFPTQYKAIAVYDNNSTADVTDSALWSVEPNDNCGIAAGLLTTEMVDLPTEVTITAQYSEADVTQEAQKQVSILPICSSGTALKFDGVDDYVSLSGNAVTTTEFTICAWANQFGPGGGLDTQNTIFQQRDNSTGDNHSAIILGAKNPYNQAGASIRSSNGSEQRLLVNMKDYNQWHHYAVTVDSENLILYIDGIVVSTAKNNQTGNYVSSIDYVDIGRHRNAGGNRGMFNGIIDEVMIFNRALTAEKIQVLMHTRPDIDEPNLVGYWDFDEGEGQVAGDSSGNGNDGIIIDAVWTDSVPPVGICTNRQLMERNFSEVFNIKTNILEQLEKALSKEQAIEYLLGECIVGGELGDVKKSDLAKAEHDLSTAVRKENRAKTSVDESIDNLDDALESLDIELPVED